MQQELFEKEKKGFQHISELLPSAMERVLERANNPLWWPEIPEDDEGKKKWLDENL